MISIKHLAKSYGNLQVLKDVNTEISKGEVISIIGPSGTGKSTLLRCINLLERPTSGEIYVDGENILARSCNVPALRRKMGMVFQSFNLFENRMIIENAMAAPVDLLKVSKKDALETGMKLLDMVGLSSKAYSYPDELSGGQKQRAAIARTLAMQPEIILFDEPTSALDPTMVGEVLSVIRKLASQGMTMLIVTHEMRVAQEISSRVFYMDEGIIYEDGTAQQIFEKPQKDKTRAFIHRIKSYQKSIRVKNFDYFQLYSELDEFAKKYYLSKVQTNDLQLMVEELVLNLILPRQKEDMIDIDLGVSYLERDHLFEISVEYGGEKFNPFEDEDDLAVKILTKKTRRLDHRFVNGKNRIELTI
jgi:polar amino acid transport system ATP-binding protein